jgi:hypothetical protein
MSGFLLIAVEPEDYQAGLIRDADGSASQPLKIRCRRRKRVNRLLQ